MMDMTMRIKALDTGTSSSVTPRGNIRPTLEYAAVLCVAPFIFGSLGTVSAGELLPASAFRIPQTPPEALLSRRPSHLLAGSDGI